MDRGAAGRSTERIRVAAWCIAALAGVLSYTPTIAACSCEGLWKRTDADLIFEGKAIEVHQPLHLRAIPKARLEGIAEITWRMWFDTSGKFDHDVRTTFQVNRVWRGQVSRFVTVNTGSGTCCNCTVGKIFEEGKDYIVFAVQT